MSQYENAAAPSQEEFDTLSDQIETINTVTISTVSGQKSYNGQSYQTIFSALPAGVYIIVCSFAGDCNLIVCKGSINTASNVFGDVAPGGVAYAELSAATDIKIYLNTNDTSSHTLYRCHFEAIKIR